MYLFAGLVVILISGNQYIGLIQQHCVSFNMHRSESPSQVFLIVLQWLYETLQTIPVDKWSEVVLAYDAMCKLDGLKVCSLPLPLPKPFDNMWMAITKVYKYLHS